jgi:hypothetical protein
MRPVKDGSDRDSERPRAGLALPSLRRPVAAGMPTDLFALAIWTDRLTAPAYLFQVFYSLILGFEGLEKLDDIHGLSPRLWTES